MMKMRMKLICKSGLHSNFSSEYSISRIKWALSRKEIDDVIAKSNIWWRGRSYAASVASDVPEPEPEPQPHKDHGKRVPKKARRALIESFVDKYKAINGGKFPSVSHTKREVGGSFYVVRNILQELQNVSATSNLKSREIPNAGSKHLEAASGRKMSSSYAEKTLFDDDKLASLVSVSHSTVSSRRNLLENVSKESSSTSYKEPYRDGKKVMDSSDFVGAERRMLINEQESITNVHQESKSSSGELTYEGSNHKEQVRHSLELDRQKINDMSANDVELSNKSKPWRHIKSIVDGIINLWRNV